LKTTVPLLQKEAITEFTLFTVCKDEWDTKETTAKSMKNALYVLYYGMTPLRLK